MTNNSEQEIGMPITRSVRVSLFLRKYSRSFGETTSLGKEQFFIQNGILLEVDFFFFILLIILIVNTATMC